MGPVILILSEVLQDSWHAAADFLHVPWSLRPRPPDPEEAHGRLDGDVWY